MSRQTTFASSAAAILAVLLAHASLWAASPLLTRPDWGRAEKKGNVTRIPLNLDNVTGRSHKGVAVKGGVPLPKGMITSSRQARVLAPDGRVVASQQKRLAVWGDGKQSIKWLLVEFLADLPAGKGARYTLEVGPEVSQSMLRPANPVSVKVDGKTATLTNGMVTFTVGGKTPWFQSIQLAGKTIATSSGRGAALDVLLYPRGKIENRQGAPLPDGKATRSRAVIDTVTVESPGPIRAQVCVAGRFLIEGGWGHPFFFRFELSAGSPAIRVLHTWVYMGREDTNIIRDIPVWFQLGGRGVPKVTYGVSGDKPKVVSGGVDLWQDRHDHFAATAAAGAKDGRRLSGWIDVSRGDAALTVAVRDWHQNYPKSFVVDARTGTLEVGLYPKRSGPLDIRNPRPNFTEKAVRYGFAGLQGSGKTHEMLVCPRRRDADPSVQADLFQEPPILYTTPEWVCDSMVYGTLTPYDPTRRPQQEAYLAAHVDFLLFHQQHQPWYGMLYYGNLRSEYAYGQDSDRGFWKHWRKAGWNSGEQNNLHGLWLQYARSGLRRWYRYAEAYQRCQNETLTGHYGRRIGTRPSHGPFKEMGYAGRRHWTEPWSSRATSDRHSYPQGYYDYYYLTGDARTLQVAKSCFEPHAATIRRAKEGVSYPDGAHCSSAMGTMFGLYEVTGLKQYRDVLDVGVSKSFTIKGWNGQYQITNGAQDVCLRYYHHVDDAKTRARLKAGLLERAAAHLVDVRYWGRHDLRHRLLKAGYMLSGDRKYLDRELPRLKQYGLDPTRYPERITSISERQWAELLAGRFRKPAWGGTWGAGGKGNEYRQPKDMWLSEPVATYWVNGHTSFIFLELPYAFALIPKEE